MKFETFKEKRDALYALFDRLQAETKHATAQLRELYFDGSIKNLEQISKVEGKADAFIEVMNFINEQVAELRRGVEW